MKLPATPALVLVAICTLAACQRAEPPESASADVRPALDLSTPDKALKSYWALKDWLRHQEAPSKSVIERHLIEIKKVTEGDAYAATYKEWNRRATTDKVERTITEVKTESDSRAVIHVRIRNVTPAEPGAALDSKWVRDQREKGATYRYVLERDGGQWRVTQALYTLNIPGDLVWRPLFTTEPHIPLGSFP